MQSRSSKENSAASTSGRSCSGCARASAGDRPAPVMPASPSTKARDPCLLRSRRTDQHDIGQRSFANGKEERSLASETEARTQRLSRAARYAVTLSGILGGAHETSTDFVDRNLLSRACSRAVG